MQIFGFPWWGVVVEFVCINVGGPVLFCQMLVQVPERVACCLYEDKWLVEGTCDLKTALKFSEGRNIYCNT